MSSTRAAVVDRLLADARDFLRQAHEAEICRRPDVADHRGELAAGRIATALEVDADPRTAHTWRPL